MSLKPGDENARKTFLASLTQVDSRRTGNVQGEPSLSEPRQFGCGPLCIIASAMRGLTPRAHCRSCATTT